jgi:methylmalonyl-CoA mutase
MEKTIAYQPAHKIRIVTAASLFDGHDAAINIMRRIMQAEAPKSSTLGHNRSVEEIVDCAIQEDVQGIAITSYQGGHNEFFKYMHDLLRERGAGHIKIFGGGGGTILPSEIEELHRYGINRIYSPDDGRRMGLQGMINDVLRQCDFVLGDHLNGELKNFDAGQPLSIARLITSVRKLPGNGIRMAPTHPRTGSNCHRTRVGHHRHRRRGQVEFGGRTGAPVSHGI